MAGFEFVRAVTERFRARPPHAQARTRASWWVEPAVFALFTVVAFAMLLPLPLHVRTHGVDFGWDDSYINTHFMRVFQDWLLGLRPGHRALDADFFYPHPLALTTNDACLGLSVMLLPLRAVTDDYLAMMNLGVLVSFPLSAHAVYLFVRDGSGRPLEEDSTRNGSLRRGAGVVAGILFAFSAYRFHQLDHPGLEQMQWLPYLAWALLRTSRAPEPRRLLALVPFLFQALFASSNLAIYAFPAIVFLGLFFLILAAEKLRYLAVTTVAAAIVAALIVPIYVEHFEGVHNYAITRGLEEIQGFSAKPEQFFAVPKFLALWGPRFGDKLGWESATFLTVTGLALAPLAFLGAVQDAGARAIAQVLLVSPAIVGAGVIGIVHPIPILLAGRSVQRLEGHFPVEIGELREGAEITYTLRLGDGPPSAPTTFTLRPPADPRLPCTLRGIAGGPEKGGVYRQLFEVETPNPHEHGLATLETQGPEDRPLLPERDSTGFPLAHCAW